MKISQKTIETLKNFATINQGIVVEGNSEELKTISVGGNIIAFAEIPEKFPSDFAVYDLTQFLNTVSLFTDPEFTFENKYVTIKDSKGNGACKYVYTDSSLVTTFHKNVKMPPAEVQFSLTQEKLSKVLRAASIMSLPDIIVTNNDDGKILVRAADKEDDSSSTYDVEVGEYAGDATFSFHYKTEYFKMLPYDYDVSISSKLISEFKNEKEDVTYYVGVAKSSTFEE